MIRVAVILRSFNESADVVRGCLEALDGALSERPGWENIIVFVEDGSRPSLLPSLSAGGMRSADTVWLRHPVRLGPGAALETALECVRRLDPAVDFIATLDPDGQHDPRDLRAMIDGLEAGGVDPTKDRAVVMGSRFLGAAPDIRVARRWLLRAARWLLRLFYGYRLTDAHNGLRVLTRAVVESIRLKSSDFSYASELLEELRGIGARLNEHPVTVRYTDYSRGKGQRDANALTILWEMIARKLVP